MEQVIESHFARRRRLADGKAWIPPVPLVFGLLAQGVGWIAFGFISGDSIISGWGLVWIHAMVLGWLTSTSLAFLIHVLPTFTDIKLHYERLARASLWSYLLGVALLLIAFAQDRFYLMVLAGILITLSIIAFAISALRTVMMALRVDDTATRAVARALGITIVVLVATVTLGTIIAVLLRSGNLTSLRIVHVHAALGLIGWLSVLVVGVSSRTFNRLLGRSRSRKHVHIIVGMCAWLGLGLLILAYATAFSGIVYIGALVLMAGALTYASDNLIALRNGSAIFARLFIGAAQIWLIISVICGGFAVFGSRRAFTAMLVAGILGWIGQTVYAHIAHVGVRLIATLVLGADDTTSPKVLIDARAGWLLFCIAQASVGAGLVSIFSGQALAYHMTSDLGLATVASAFLFVLLAASNARQLSR